MSEHDFKHAATDAKHTQVEATREAAEIISALIKAAMRERDGKEPKKAPKVEIFSGPNKIYPPRDGVEIKPEQVDNLLDTLANEKAGSVRIYLEQDGKREKIFHQTQGVVKADPLGLKEAMAKELGPKLADRQKSEVEQQAKSEQKGQSNQTEAPSKEPTGIEALKEIYNQDKEAFSESFPSTAKRIEEGESNQYIGQAAYNSDALINDPAELHFLSETQKQEVKTPHPIGNLVEQERNLNQQHVEVRQKLADTLHQNAPLAEVKAALSAVENSREAIHENHNEIRQGLSEFAEQYGRDASVGEDYKEFIQIHNDWNPDRPLVHGAEQQEQPPQEVSPSHEQSSDIPPLDHPEQSKEQSKEQTQSQEESPSPQEEATVEQTQAREESQTQTQQPSEALEQGDRSQESPVGESVAPVADNLKYPDETQAQASNLDPAYQAAKAEFDRRLSQFQDNLDKLQQQVHKVSEQIAPLVNDPNLQQWAKEGSQRHHQAMRPLRDQISVVRQTVYDRLKNMGQKIDDLGRKATEKLSDLQAKAIDKSVTWLVNSRYGQDTGRGGRVFEGDNQTFKKIGNSVIISRNSDKAEVYNNGRYTKAANTQDKKAIAALPNKVVDLRQKIEQKQSQSQTQQRSAGRGR